MNGHFNVLLVDDHFLFRSGVKGLLAEQADLRFAGEAANYGQAMQFVRNNPCDIVVVDLSMPGRDGLELITSLKKTFPKLPVLVLTVHTEEEVASLAIRSGAKGFLTKDVTGEELLDAMRRVATGHTAISHSVAEAIAMQLGREQDSQTSVTALSHREFKVYQMLGQGMRISAIAKELNLSIKTVHTYKQRLLRKLALNSQFDVIRHFICHNLDRSGEHQTDAVGKQ